MAASAGLSYWLSDDGGGGWLYIKDLIDQAEKKARKAKARKEGRERRHA